MATLLNLNTIYSINVFFCINFNPIEFCILRFVYKNRSIIIAKFNIDSKICDVLTICGKSDICTLALQFPKNVEQWVKKVKSMSISTFVNFVDPLIKLMPFFHPSPVQRRCFWVRIRILHILKLLQHKFQFNRDKFDFLLCDFLLGILPKKPIS